MKKKIKKQIISILLVGSVVLSSVGCAQKSPASVNKQIHEENDITEVMAEVGNKRIVPQKSETTYPTESNETSLLYDTVENTIDIYAINRSINVIDSSKTWDNTLFYELEDINPKSDEDGKLKTYVLTEKQFVDSTTGNHITLEIYRSLETNAINKIVCIEEKDGQLLITDFYYLDSGQLNFAFERTDSIYTPTYASPDKVGYRYYFSDDTMVKWRKVEQPQQIVDYIVNEADKGTGQKFLYSNLTSNEQHEYDDKATSILNIAYNVYEAATEEKDSDREQGNIDGFVHDAGGQPMADVSVDIYEEDLSSHVGTITTDDEGHYSTGISYNDKAYLLVFRLEGYVEVELYSVYVSRDNPSVTCEGVCMIPADIDACEVTLNIYDEAETKQDADLSAIGLKDTTVTVRAGVNHTSGDDLGCYTCDETGALVLQLDPGAYTLEINCEGYVVFIRVIFVFEDSLIGIPMTTELKDRQMKIVLNWEGNSDLDACLFTPYEGNEGDMSYVNPDTPEDDYGNRLSKDSQDGNLSEVILIDDYTTGTYKYYVSDYQGCISGNEYGANLKMLYVVVMIYDANGLVARYAVPYSDGIIWEVCWIQSGKVVPVQKMYNSTTGKNWWSKEKNSKPIRLDRIAGEKTGRIDSIQIQDMYGKYLTTRDGKVRGGATSVGTEEQFVPIRCSDGTYAFRSMSTRDFVKSSGKSYGGFISDDHKIQLKEYAGVRDTYYIQFSKVSGKQWLTIDKNEKWKLVDEEDRGRQESTILIRRVAVIEPLLLILFSIPYVLSSFSIRVEVIEYSVGMFSMIVLAWEMYILLGLVPVNMQYPSVFEHSTIALQILNKEGNCLIRSKYNYQIDEDMFHQLCDEKAVLLAEGKELNLTPIKSGYTVWSKDVSQMMDVVEKLSENVERLEKENTLRRQEIKIRSEEVALNEKNKLYDQLSEEVGAQLEVVEQKLRERNTRQDTERLFGEICYIGTYIKRRSNFRIVEQEEGSVCREDMELVLRDLISNLHALSIPCEVVWVNDICPTGQCFLRSIDALEEELEKADFRIQYLKLLYLSKQEFQLECQFTGGKRSMRYGSED